MPPKKGFIFKDSEEIWRDYVNLCAINYPVLAWNTIYDYRVDMMLSQETCHIICEAVEEKITSEAVEYFCGEIDAHPEELTYVHPYAFHRGMLELNSAKIEGKIAFFLNEKYPERTFICSCYFFWDVDDQVWKLRLNYQ